MLACQDSIDRLSTEFLGLDAGGFRKRFDSDSCRTSFPRFPQGLFDVSVIRDVQGGDNVILQFGRGASAEEKAKEARELLTSKARWNGSLSPRTTADMLFRVAEILARRGSTGSRDTSFPTSSRAHSDDAPGARAYASIKLLRLD